MPVANVLSARDHCSHPHVVPSREEHICVVFDKEERDVYRSTRVDLQSSSLMQSAQVASGNTFASQLSLIKGNIDFQAILPLRQWAGNIAKETVEVFL